MNILDASNIPSIIGIPTIVNNYIESQLELNSYLVSSPNSTFYAKLDTNDSLVGGVKKGSILIVDRSIPPTHNKLVVVVCEEKFLLRRICTNTGIQLLVTDNQNDEPIIIAQDSYIWGVVKTIITKLK